MTPTRSHQPITPFPTNVRTASCGDARNTNRVATPAATIAKNKTFSHRSRSHRSRPHHRRRYGSRIHGIGASPRRLMRSLWLSAPHRKTKLGAGPVERRNKVTSSALQSAWSEAQELAVGFEPTTCCLQDSAEHFVYQRILALSQVRTITGIPGVSCSVASGRVAHCLGTASGPGPRPHLVGTPSARRGTGRRDGPVFRNDP
jgi:hypothetical protein